MLVELLKRRDGKSVRSAVDHIAKAQIFQQNSEALRNRYREALKHKHLKSIWQFLSRVADGIGEERFIEALESGIGDRLR
jgi:hypothetical protein